METTQEEFQVRVYLKTELAQLYAPHLNPEAALRKMRKWIHRNPELYHELYAGTEGKNELAYSKRQVAVLVRYWILHKHLFLPMRRFTHYYIRAGAKSILFL